MAELHPSLSTPRDLLFQKKVLTSQEKVELYTFDEEVNGYIRGDHIVTKYNADEIETDDILISVNGVYDSRNNRAIEKKVLWNPYEEWKSTGVSGELRWNRGVAGVFGEYENLWGLSLNDINQTRAGVSDWEKLEFTAAVIGSTQQQDSVSRSSAFGSFRCKRGNSDTVRFNLQLGAIAHFGFLTFSTGLITISGGTFDLLEAIEIVANQEYLVRIIVSEAPSGTDSLNLSASNTAAAGLYTYVKDIVYVGGVDYSVPYVKGTHTPDSWIQPVDWASSENWSIDIWCKAQDDSPIDNHLITIGNDSKDAVDIRYIASGVVRITTTNGGVSTSVNSVSQTTTEYHHIKVVWVSTTSVALYFNGSLLITATVNVPDISIVAPVLYIGQREDGVAQFVGFIADMMIRPSFDVSTDHYDSGLWWTNPENVFEAEMGAYVDKFGNYVGESFSAPRDDVYSIWDQYTVDDQTVTKWSNGDMEISGKQVFSSLSITTPSNTMYRTSSAVADIDLIESFISVSEAFSNILDGTGNYYQPKVAGLTTSSVQQFVFSDVSITVSITIGFSVKGKWK